MSSNKGKTKFKIREIGRVFLKPPDEKKGETIINIIEKIQDNPRLNLLKIAILASPRNKETQTLQYGQIKLKLSSQTFELPKLIHKICNDYSETDLINDLNDLKRDTDYKYNIDLRFYIDYLQLLDKGDLSNNAYVIVEFKKMDEINPQSEVGITIYPESKPLDVAKLYRAEWDKRREIWKKTKKNKIDNISLNYENHEFVEAKFVASYTRNLFKSEVCEVRECTMKEYIRPEKVYEPFEQGTCKIGNKSKYLLELEGD